VTAFFVLHKCNKLYEIEMKMQESGFSFFVDLCSTIDSWHYNESISPSIRMSVTLGGHYEAQVWCRGL